MKKSPDLGARYKNVIDSYNERLAQLKPEAKAFAENMTEFLSKLFDEDVLHPSTVEEIAMGVINKFKALRDDVKEDFQKAFPAAAAFLTSEETVKRLQEQ
ncbi:unnamed protein product [Cylicocyclus nassatus]|uniref:Uncharacterized protein n=1 Tax=Cylicocyclus nassatus TaxID=53992 RepID=A0AA36GU80_CYLNA|nr:unnamed protein product [Cylicocyclus nassatus]